jgi:ribosomal-protein-alanine N-acetyltransferase
MTEHPVLETERLVLRLITFEDIPDIQRLAGDKDVASQTSDSEIPQPGAEEQWFKKRQEEFEKGEAVDFVIIHRDEGTLIGAIGLGAEYKQDESMQLGYWIGKPYWNQGYCTEAARAVVKYGFDALHLNRIFARHFGSNPTSGRVMQKIGMKYEGTMRKAIQKWGRFEDMACYAILKSEFNLQRDE